MKIKTRLQIAIFFGILFVVSFLFIAVPQLEKIFASGLVDCSINVNSGFNINSLTKPIFEVASYGALCNGSTDDSAAIQAANNAAALADGTVVYPANATCMVKGVYVKADQYGYGATLKLPNASDNWIFNISSSTPNIRIADFTFDGNTRTQPMPTFADTYAGLAKNSLIQATSLFTNAVIENNTFQNTDYGAMAFEVQASGGGTIHQISTLKILNNTFANIQTEVVRVTNPYDLRTVSGSDIYMNGTAIFQSNITRTVGVVTTTPIASYTEHADSVTINGFRCAYAQNNVMKRSARADFRFGANNHIVVAHNKSFDLYWNFVKTETLPIDASANNLPGAIQILDNVITSTSATDTLISLAGSSDVAANHTIVPELQIIGNKMEIYGDNSNHRDAIKFGDNGKYLKAYIKNNVFSGIRKAAVAVVLPTKDSFAMSELVMQDNSVRGSGLDAANALFTATGSGNPIAKLKFINNIVDSVTNGIIVPSVNYAADLIMQDNSFYYITGANVFSGSGSTAPTTATIKNNYFDGAMVGFSTSTTQTIWSDNNFGSPQQCTSVL
jgi:hypothetical protein